MEQREELSSFSCEFFMDFIDTVVLRQWVSLSGAGALSAGTSQDSKVTALGEAWQCTKRFHSPTVRRNWLRSLV